MSQLEPDLYGARFDEHEVVAAARLLFNETGYHGTSVDDLSRVDDGLARR